jgi:outer membrane protein
MRAASTALLACLACSAGAASALETGDVIVRAGVAQVSPSVSDHTGLDLSVSKDTELGLTATYMVSPVIGFQLLGASPFSHDIKVGGVKHATTRQLPPTLTLQWYPAVSATVHPYVGAGVNYTRFFSTKNDLGVDLKLSDSVGLALEAGVDVNVTDKVLVNLAVWKINISSDVKINDVKQGSVDIDPLAAMIGVGYRF